jgi:hypothetical protein
MVIAQGVAIREAAQVARIPVPHVHESHQLATLAGISCRHADRVSTSARRNGDPGEEIEPGVVATGLLPHLKEAMDRIAGRRGQRRGCGT